MSSAAFFILTRGRTGSSAIVEELNNHPDIMCHSEIFRPNPLARPRVREAFEKHGKDYVNIGGTSDKVLPFRLHNDLKPEDPLTKESFNSYFAYLMEHSGGASAVGAKVLVNHIDGPSLMELGNQLDYPVTILWLQRRNLLRQIVSAQVAKLTGVHNRSRYRPEEGRRFTLEVPPIIARLKSIRKQYEEYEAAMAVSKTSVLKIFYEDWVNDREAFFDPIFSALNVEFSLPDRTTFSRTTPEPLSTLLENFDDIAKHVKKAGFGELLELVDT